MKYLFENTDYSLKINSINNFQKTSKAFQNEHKKSEDHLEDKKQEETITSITTAVQFFNDNHNLVNVSFEYILFYCKTVQFLLNKVDNMSQIDEDPIFKGNGFKSCFIELLDFLKFLATHSSFKISLKEINGILNCFSDCSQKDSIQQIV